MKPWKLLCLGFLANSINECVLSVSDNGTHTYSLRWLGKPQKKISSTRPLRGGGARPLPAPGKGWAIKEKRTFFETFLKFCCYLKIKIILL